MNTQILKNILSALMEISVKGNDVITMNNIFQALQQVIAEAEAASMAVVNKDEE